MIEETKTISISITDEQYEYLKNECIDKSKLLERVIDKRMENPVLEL